MALDGTARETIGREIVRLQAQYYGRGPTRARTYATGDVVVVVLEETFTPAEKTLISRGEGAGIKDIRHRFQIAMADEFSSVVEQATGRKVRFFSSDTDLENDLSIEVFILADARTDMSAFEPGQEPAGE
jgi:uncharacterized protein YbcI